MSSSEVPGPNDPILLERLLLDLLDLKLKGHALFELRKKNIAFLRLHIPPHPLDLSMSLPSSPSLARGGKVGTEVVQASVDQKMTSVEHLVLNLCDPTLCERSLAELSKDENTKATVYLLKYDTIPLCLKIMEIGNEPSKTVSTFILLKVLLNDFGLKQCCDTRSPFYEIAFALQKMVSSPDDRPSARLLKCIIRCYHRLFDHPRGHAVFKTWLPSVLQNRTFNDYLMKDPSMQECLQQLLAKLEVGSPNQAAPFSPPQ